jgi:hypothetical protein
MRVCVFFPILLLVVLPGCAMSTYPGDIEPLPRGTTVRLIEVYCDYDTWGQVSSAEIERAKEKETEWLAILKDGFLKAAEKRGILDDGPDALTVTIAVVDTYPGSSLSNEWIGYGSGQAKAKAAVTLRGHGTFEIGTVIPNDNIEDKLRELGAMVADHIHERIR